MKKERFGVALETEDGKLLRREAKRKGLCAAALIREWIEPKLVEALERERCHAERQNENQK